MTSTSPKIDLQFKNEKVRFSISSCTTDKKHSFYTLTKQEAEQFIKRLQYLEQYTWSQFANPAKREDGLTTEKPNLKSFDLIDQQNKDYLLDQIYFREDKYYFHFRVGKLGLFRVFGYQYKQFFYITHLDPKGKIHHS